MLPMWILTLSVVLLADTCVGEDIYTGIGSVAEFIARLDISAASQAQVSETLNSPFVRDLQDGNRTAETNRARRACLVGRAVFGSKLHTANSSDFTALINENWSETCWLAPQCIVQPESSADVSRVMLIASFLGSQFSIRSGGHNPNVGFSSVGEEGILIDLARLNEVTLSPDGKYAAIGPGNRWGRVYHILSSKGKMAVGGRANDIGVGGLLLGGGLSYWSSIYGLAFNRIVNYEVVLANGSIVNANQTYNKELWWALRGGGANFGIVTRFDVRTVENGQIWFEGLFVNATENRRVLRTAVDFAAAAESDPDISVTYYLGLNGGAIYLAYNKPIERPAVFKPFYDIPHQNVINSTMGNWVDLHNAVSALNPLDSLRVAISSYDRKWDVETLLDHYTQYENATIEAQEKLNANFYFAPQVFTQSAVAVNAAQGGTPIQLLKKNHCFLEIMASWTDPASDQGTSLALARLGGAITASAKKRGTDLHFHYMNDAGTNQNVLKDYGSLKEMRRVSKRYDPYQVFQYLQHGGFLLANA